MVGNIDGELLLSDAVSGGRKMEKLRERAEKIPGEIRYGEEGRKKHRTMVLPFNVSSE